jgi:hypothetical protein
MQPLPVFVLQHASDLEHSLSDGLLRYSTPGKPYCCENPEAAHEVAKSSEHPRRLSLSATCSKCECLSKKALKTIRTAPRVLASREKGKHPSCQRADERLPSQGDPIAKPLRRSPKGRLRGAAVAVMSVVHM